MHIIVHSKFDLKVLNRVLAQENEMLLHGEAELESWIYPDLDLVLFRVSKLLLP